MENLTHTHIFNPSVFRFFAPSLSNPTRRETLNFSRIAKKKFVVLSSKGDPPRLNSWELMELKFGRMIGEDPKLTMAKIMGKRMNPDMSNLDIEKMFYNKKNKGKITDIEELPFDVSGTRLSSSESPNGSDLVRPVPDVSGRMVSSSGSPNGLNLVRPIPKKGVKFETNSKPKEVLKVKRPGQPAINASLEDPRSREPDVILRKKPSIYSEDDETENSSRLRIKPNFSLKMSEEQTKERFTDLTMIRRPEPINSNLETKEVSASKEELSSDIEEIGSKMGSFATKDVSLLGKPEMILHKEEGFRDYSGLSSANEMTEKDLDQFLETADLFQHQGQSDEVVDSNTQVTVNAALQGKPERLDQYVKERPKTSREELLVTDSAIDDVSFEFENFTGTDDKKEHEDADWARAEDLARTEGREEVELISSSSKGFVVSFGSLLGYLPYRYLSPKYKYLAFESWLRRNNLDPASYKENLGVIGNYESTMTNSTSLDSNVDQELDIKMDLVISPDTKLQDLLKLYEREKSKFLLSFVGQKINANVILADRTSRRLIFSCKPREKEEAIRRKKALMAKLRVGDVVKCCIVKITFFGIFVKVEGVPALIHQTEVSWDSTLDPTTYFKIGQVVDAKVHQLDFSLERIFLSLKDLMPDPLIESIESVFADNGSLDERLEVQPDTEWAEVETLIKELEQVDGIESVSKGRYCLSPSLAPTFQVYMASMFENQYKLLARSENKVQEVIVQTSLSKEEMKFVIQTCTNRVS